MSPGLAGGGTALRLGEAALALVLVCGSTLAQADDRSHPIRGTLAEQDQGFARATAPRAFVFPEDHGPHYGYRNEWWYFTGNLGDAAGRRFGYELTFFRFALTPGPLDASGWRSNQVYMAHFALTDVAAGTFHAFERFNRAAQGLAGAENRHLQVWLDDWSARTERASFPVRLQASAEGIAIDLTLEQGKPAVLQGDRGLSRKGSEPGNASYYYSYTRMPTHGSIGVAGDAYTVDGLSWMDREWGTSALGADQVGWDWFALQLSDGAELMFYRLRRADGTTDPHSAGSLVSAWGDAMILGHDEVRIEERAQWRSPNSGVRYPARWRLQVPTRRLELEVEPLLADQELDLSFRYWEGAVQVSGTRDGRSITGRGYVELTGYGK